MKKVLIKLLLLPLSILVTIYWWFNNPDNTEDDVFNY